MAAAKPVKKTVAKPKTKVVTKPGVAVKTTVKPKKLIIAEVTPVEAVKTTSRWQTGLRRIGRFIAASSLPEVMVIATLAMARYIKNSDFSYPSEIILDIVLLGILASIIFYVYRIALRNRLGAHLAGLLMAYSLYNFNTAFPRLRSLSESLIPNRATNFEHALLQILILGIIFGLIGYAVQRLNRLPQFKSWPLLKFVVFVVCFVFAVQVGKVGLRLWEIRKDLTYKQPTSQLGSAVQAASKPNVYYLLFDRYANDTTLKNIYNFDNTPLLSNLAGQGFVVRHDAYANYPFTMQSVSSTLSVGYHAKLGAAFAKDGGDFQTGFPYRTILDNSPVTQAFQKSGYQYNQVSSWWDFTRDNPSADTNPSKSFRLRLFGKNFWVTDLQRDIINKSALSPLLLKGMTISRTTLMQYQLDRNPTQNFYAQLTALRAIASGSKTQTKPQFSFAHILSPHDPYIFDAEGNAPTYDGNRTDNGIDETLKYTNQLSYINNEMTKLISYIRTNDPTAAIVIQADEGPYPKQFRGTLTSHSYYDPITLPLAQERQKFGVLAAYYMPGADPASVSQNVNSSVNTFRYVLNNYVGYHLPYLPDCQFAVGDKFQLFNYQLVTGQLKNQPQPATCQQYK